MLKPFYFIFLFSVLLTQNVFSMDYMERLHGKVMVVSSEGKHFIMGRGWEDGVELKDLAKFYLDKKYKFHATAIQVEENYSEWVITKRVPSFLPRVNHEMTFLSLYPYKKKPEIVNIDRYRDRSLMNSYVDKSMARKKSAEENLILAKRREIEELLKEKKKRATRDDYKFARDERFQIPDMSFSIFASPLSYKSPYGQKTISYGGKVENIDQEKYEFKADYSYYMFRREDPYTRNVVSSSDYFGNIYFDINHIWGKLSYASMINYKRDKDGFVYPTRKQWSFGPLGMKYDFYESKFVKDFSFSYIPQLEYFVGDAVRDGNFFCGDAVFCRNQLITNKDNYLRHAFSIKLQIEKGDFSLKNITAWKPRHDFDRDEYIDWHDSDFSNELEASWVMFKRISFTYENIYTWDIRRERNLKQPESEMEHVLSFTYKFDWADNRFWFWGKES